MLSYFMLPTEYCMTFSILLYCYNSLYYIQGFKKIMAADKNNGDAVSQ